MLSSEILIVLNACNHISNKTKQPNNRKNSAFLNKYVFIYVYTLTGLEK